MSSTDVNSNEATLVVVTNNATTYNATEHGTSVLATAPRSTSSGLCVNVDVITRILLFLPPGTPFTAARMMAVYSSLTSRDYRYLLDVLAKALWPRCEDVFRHQAESGSYNNLLTDDGWFEQLATLPELEGQRNVLVRLVALLTASTE